ncbi:hypothetical protein BZG20_13595 [Salinivibrio sp. IB868]|uniref:hypothetical protein n=1 Tax=Salinivibrio sp. IB868 TaxID=1909447 RepID=UPI000986CD98|nr:hypothetical protein [Salinivibrio sp. IB868]OOE65136.1 hypothetical protein BZG20_13595 [Salinivibrio sp. IB868]
MTNRENIDSIKKRLYEAEVVHYWEHKGWGGKYEYLWRWGVAIFVNYSIFILLWLALDGFTVGRPFFWVVLSFMTMMMLITRYLFTPDKHRCYHLTPLGIHYTENDMIPDVAYQVVRGFAWVGIVVCIIAVFVLGPLAFVGAGGFALMSFGMTNFKPTTEKHEVFFSDRPILFNPMNDSVLRIDSNIPTEYCSSRNFYFSSLEEKDAVVSLIKKN